MFYKEPFTNWEYIVDAKSGVIIRAYNKTTSIYPIAENDRRDSANYEVSNTLEEAFVTGVGDVYPEHPGNSSVTTKNLSRLDGNGKLDGTHVRVKNSVTSEAYSPSETFQYATGNTHFDEVSLYYHVDNFRQNYIEYLYGGNTLFNFYRSFCT